MSRTPKFEELTLTDKYELFQRRCPTEARAFGVMMEIIWDTRNKLDAVRPSQVMATALRRYRECRPRPKASAIRPAAT